MALRRMMTRRGISSYIHCDRRTNFQGANNELPRFTWMAMNCASIHFRIARNRKQFCRRWNYVSFQFTTCAKLGWQWEFIVKVMKHPLTQNVYIDHNNMRGNVDTTDSNPSFVMRINHRHERSRTTHRRLFIGRFLKCSLDTKLGSLFAKLLYTWYLGYVT